MTQISKEKQLESNLEFYQEWCKQLRSNRKYYVLAGVMVGVGIFGLILIATGKL